MVPRRKVLLAIAIIVILVVGSYVYLGHFLGLEEANWTKDSDGDGINDYDEINVYHSNPHKVDTDGGGVNDFHEVFTYGLDPKNATDDRELVAKLPNVEAKLWDLRKVPFTVKDYNTWINYSLTDPLIDYLAKRSTIVPSEDGKNSMLYVDGLPAFNKQIADDIGGIENPSYFFTHGRNSICTESALANIAILREMGFKAILVPGKTSSNTEVDHAWTEALIDGDVYVIDYNNVAHREGFYESRGWIIDTDSWGLPPYSPDWFKGD